MIDSTLAPGGPLCSKAVQLNIKLFRFRDLYRELEILIQDDLINCEFNRLTRDDSSYFFGFFSTIYFFSTLSFNIEFIKN